MVFKTSDPRWIFGQIGIWSQTCVLDCLNAAVMVVKSLGRLVMDFGIEAAGDGCVQIFAVKKSCIGKSHALKLGMPRTGENVDLVVRAYADDRVCETFSVK